jgi:hypothetical protein
LAFAQWVWLSVLSEQTSRLAVCFSLGIFNNCVIFLAKGTIAAPNHSGSASAV